MGKYENIDKIIRAGRIPEARVLTQSESEKKLARPDRTELAQLAARVGLPELGLRLLRKSVQHRAATVEEINEYALCLIRIGAVDEAKSWLQDVEKANGRTRFCRALAEISFWEYGKAIPHLKAFIDDSSTEPYQKNVGTLNLIAAYVFEKQFKEAEREIESLADISAKNGNDLLLANTFELAAGCAIYQGHYEDAEKTLAKAETRLKDLPTVDSLFLAKWKAVLGIVNAELEAAERFRALARERRHWESLRECDRFQAVLSKDQDLLTKVYFGTPYSHYRRRLLEDFGRGARVPEVFEWSLGEGDAPPPSDLLWNAGTFSPKLRVGQVLHRLLLTLTSDFYRPFRVASLHEKLFPGQFFNPDSSVKRVHAALARLRDWFEEHSIPLRLSEDQELYSLTSLSPYALKLKVFDSDPNLPAPLVLLRTRSQTTAFTVEWASRLTSLPSRSVSRLLSTYTREGVLKRTGKGKATRYRFAA